MTVVHLLTRVSVVDDRAFDGLLKGASEMATKGEPDGADNMLEALQKAVEEQARILDRQGRLIRRLRSELKGVDERGRDGA
jgi:hypothetical protein